MTTKNPRGRSFNFRAIVLGAIMVASSIAAPVRAAEKDAGAKKKTIEHALAWLADQQARDGRWAANENRYPTAMTALAGLALLCEGSTTTQGKYSRNVQRAVDFLLNQSQTNGLIGNPTKDDRYTYGHGFSMLFLSQVLGEEEGPDRRKRIVDVLSRAVIFSGRAQTKVGGWGYVSSDKDGRGVDEGSTTITQVQGLRGCRNAGITVPKQIIDKAVGYIKRCTRDDGGVQYSIKGGSGRPAITAAAVACLFNAGEYQGKNVPKMLKYCEKNLANIGNRGFGHWHYAHYYYAQVKYRQGGKIWEDYRGKVTARLMSEVKDDGKHAVWTQGYIGAVYTTSINLTILQLDRGCLPIYQR